MSEVTWFKVLTDIFSDDKIKILQSMPEGDSLLVMWFKVLSQAGKTNDGGYIYLKKNMPYTPGMLSTLFNKPQQLVELALRTFEQFDMIDIDDKGYIFVTNWEKHQAIEKMDKIREQTRLRVQKHRETKRLELQSVNEPVTDGVTCNVTVTQDNETEVDKDLDISTTTTKRSFMNEYTKIFNEMHMTGTMSGFFGKLRDQGYTEEFCIELLLEAAESCQGGKPSVRYLESIRDRWFQEGIYTRAESKARKNKKVSTIKPKQSSESTDYQQHLMRLQQEMRDRNEFNEGDAVNL